MMAPGQMTCDWKYAGLGPWTTGRQNGGYSPGDAALRLAIAYVWLSEGTPNNARKKPGTLAFDRFRDYVLGDRDGIPKRPQWAAPYCYVPSYTIKALARRWPESCPAGAFGFGDDEDLAELILKAKLLRTEITERPKAPYAGLPSGLIGGTVYDYEADEVIEGALVTVRLGEGAQGSGSASEAGLTVRTDELGSFLVDGPEQGTYAISIEKEGYVPREIGPLKVEDDLNLRDYAMFFDSQGLIW